MNKTIAVPVLKSTFRLYSSLNSSYFDLISGNKETQQTKGLGLLLSKSKTALKAFLEIPAIKSEVGKVDSNNLNSFRTYYELADLLNNELV